MVTLSFRRTMLLFLLLILPLITLAAAPAWQINPSKSSLIFTATQNNAPVTGQFTKFNGRINFDAAQLESSQVEINVDINSISARLSDVVDTLKTSDWFNVKLFPQAVFKANHFKKIADNKFEANGSLTIRDKTVPVKLIFTLENDSPSSVIVKGYTTLKRSMFGVGQGEWASTNEIKDDVQVNFTVSATKK